MTLYQLPTRSIVRIGGADARKLLNDTLTCRLADLGAGTARWFALLSPQGKVLAEGLVSYEDEAFWFDIDASLAADFIKRMTMYRLRASVDIAQMPDRAVLWSPDGEEPARGTWYSARDERGVRGTRYIVERADLPDDTEPAGKAYASARIEAGVAEVPDFAGGEVFPHDIGMDLRSGVDFKKGCYVGQEVVSRMQHRGTARRRPVIVRGLPVGAAHGAAVLAGEREAGTLGEVADGEAVAIVRLDRISGPESAKVGGIPVVLAIPGWAPYRFGESAEAE